ncbi:hypothetical protein ACHAXM_006437 [Skeletonema potamos]
MTKRTSKQEQSSRGRHQFSLLLIPMMTILFLLICPFQHGCSGIFVAGFATNNRKVPPQYQSVSPLAKSTTVATSKIHKTHLWYIERGNFNDEEEENDDSCMTPGGDSSSGKKKMDVVSSPYIFEDFAEDDDVHLDIVAEDQKEEEVQEMSESPPPPTPLKAIEPTKDKPPKKFISPIQLLKRVPRVQPINMTSVFFIKHMGKDAADDSKKDSLSNKKPSGDKVITWKDRMLSQQRRSTAFQATNYLESLGSSADSSRSSSSSKSNENDASNKKQDEDPETNNNALYKNLKAQQGNFREEQKKSMQDAIYEAMRRTNPKDVIQARIDQREKERKRIERERLEREYVERKERLDARKYEDEEKEEKKQAGTPSSVGSRNSRRGLPILGPFIKSPSPLLIGSTITFQYSDLTPFQKKALEVSQHYHEEHCARMKEAADQAGDEGGIQAAPIVAIIDRFTGEYTGPISGDEQKKNKRFATLSAVEMEPSQDGTGPAVVKLTGVGRVFLYDYFSSKDAGIAEEEQELENILKLIQKFDREYEEMEDDDQEDDDDNDDIPVVMASFDVVLDNSSILGNQSSKHQDATVHRSSPIHTITELYLTANRVYRLHEERKKIVAGLKLAEARLTLGKERMKENCDIEFEDCDGFGMLSGGVDFLSNQVEADITTTGTAHLSPLAQKENYGFGSFGILSTIPDLTKELMLYLESYYSPSHREREEYEAEIASFVAFRCLEEYVDPSDVAPAMMTLSATERLNMAYEVMMRHREELNEFVKMISDDLFECGDDCKDLR